MRTAAEVDPADDVDRERHDVLDVARHQSREAVAHADDVHTLERGANGRRTDDAVDAGCRPAADENSELLVMFHVRPPTPNASTAQLMIEGGLLNREAPRPFSVSTAAELVSRDTIGTHTP